jgi:hypothetical protein
MNSNKETGLVAMTNALFLFLVESGEWKVESGKWRVDSGELIVERYFS